MRRKSENYFTVVTKETATRTTKRINFTWLCRPDENPEQIAAVLNTAVGDYLRALSAARLERTPEVKRVYQNAVYQNMSEAMRQSASAILRKFKERKEAEATKSDEVLMPDEEKIKLLADALGLSA